MELNYLHDFIVLAECRNYHRAADLLYLSQSSLSKHIMSIEKELGYPLFDRSTKNITLTEFGRSFLPYARKLDETRITYLNDLFTDNEQDTVTIGISPMISPSDIVTILSPVKDVQPHLHIDIVQHPEPTLIKKLKNCECDLLIVGNQREQIQNVFDHDLYQITPLFCIPLAVLLPQKHPLAHRASVAMQDLASESFIALEKSPNWDAHFGKPSIFAEHIGLIISLVRQGFGFSVLPALDGLMATGDGVAAVPLSDSPKIQITLVCSRRRKNIILVEKILSYLKQQSKDMDKSLDPSGRHAI